MKVTGVGMPQLSVRFIVDNSSVFQGAANQVFD